MFHLFSKKDKKEPRYQLHAPVNGICIPLEDVKDPVIANHVMGDGCAFQLEEGIIYAPMDGIVVMIAATKHAFAVRGEKGMEVLIHVGSNMADLKGQGFHLLVGMNQSVIQGEPIISMDMTVMKEQCLDVTTSMIVMNTPYASLTIHHRNEHVTKDDIVVSFYK